MIPWRAAQYHSTLRNAGNLKHEERYTACDAGPTPRLHDNNRYGTEEQRVRLLLALAAF
jgi:hypothetical protein